MQIIAALLSTFFLRFTTMIAHRYTFHTLVYILPKSLWDDIQPITLRETMANKPEPTKEPIPEKKKKSPMIALCMDFGAAEYANSRPAINRQIFLV